MMLRTIGLALALTMTAVSAAPQAQEMDHSQHDMPAAADGAAKAYMDGMAKMSRDMNAPMTGDADVDFATMMIPHHQGAIDMAKVELEFGKDSELRKLSEAIITAQESEIAFLKGWLETNGKAADGQAAQHQHDDPAGKAYMDGMAKMDRDMNAGMTGDADRDFATMMIPHHRGAIDMAKVQLEHGKDAKLKTLSEAIIAAQEGEIAFLEAWLAKR